MSFKDVVGHKALIAGFKGALKSGRVGQAYLFAGPSGVGKKMVAGNFAKALNCLNNDPDGCDNCESCRKIDGYNHPDVKWYGPVGVSRNIKIDQIREISHNVSLRPYEGRKKVFIIANVEFMNPSAGNAILKTLEEPPSDTVFILTTEHKESLLPTIRSRCQIIEFKPLSIKETTEELNKRFGVSDDSAGVYAALSGGRLGKCEDLINSEYLSRRDIIIDELISGRFSTVSGTIAFVEKLIDELKEARSREESAIKESKGSITDLDKAYIEGKFKEDISETLRLIYYFYRDILLSKIRSESSLIVNRDKVDLLKDLSSKISEGAVEQILKMISVVNRALSGNANMKLAFELLFLKMGSISGIRQAAANEH